jgi:hypothetical protein
MKFIPHRIGKEVHGRQPLTKPLRTASYNWCRSHLFRNGKDVADSVRKMEKINMTTKIVPVRKISGASAAVDKATEQEGDDILNKAEIDMYMKRKHELEDNIRTRPIL